jgi:hypothetical protein
MAIVRRSRKITDAECIKKADAAAEAWQAGLTERGSRGPFLIGHGGDRPCEEAHGRVADKGFYIWTLPGPCYVFLTQAGRPSEFAGALRVRTALLRYVGPGHCSCGQHH